MSNNTDQNAKTAKGEATTVSAKPAAESPPPPKSWEDIKVGSLVLVQESLADGWWEAVVTEIRNEVVTLKWRDYPRLAPITRRRPQVALLFPGK